MFQIRQWPHNLSFLFACLTCTVGMFNISRFAVLTIDFGGTKSSFKSFLFKITNLFSVVSVSFILQFLLLSLIFGIPLFTFHISLGQYLGSGVIDVWRISPIHQVSCVQIKKYQLMTYSCFLGHWHCTDDCSRPLWHLQHCSYFMAFCLF